MKTDGFIWTSHLFLNYHGQLLVLHLENELVIFFSSYLLVLSTYDRAEARIARSSSGAIARHHIDLLLLDVLPTLGQGSEIYEHFHSY